MADVASLAGVSAQTVSRVANGRENVDPGTRDKVQVAMAALGYRANSAARSLATGSFRTIGVIASTLASHGAQQVLEGVSGEARRFGYDVTLVPLATPSVDDVSGAATQMLGRHNVDAMIVGVESSVMERWFGRVPLGVPLVVTDGGTSAAFPSVDSDPRPGLRAALEHLVALGHERIWHAGGPGDSFSARGRAAVWEEFLLERGLPVAEPLRLDWSGVAGFGAGLLVAEAVGQPGGVRPTAVVCANDQIALGLVRALVDRGLRVPEDVSVVGFDGIEAGAFAVPRLSTVTHDLLEVGRRAVRVLVAQLQPGLDPGPVGLVPSVFLDRESTAPPR